jgi:hypothetical protein
MLKTIGLFKVHESRQRVIMTLVYLNISVEEREMSYSSKTTLQEWITI